MTVTRVLVTGASGMIGHAVVGDLVAQGILVTALDRIEPDGLPADRMVIGDARDPAAVDEAMADVDAVIHLAGLASPGHGTPFEVFGGNTRATFVVLEAAGRRGIRRVALSSSYSITGLPFAAGIRHPAYLPVDENLPVQIEDPYGLSKQVDEATALMMTRRHGLTVVALRLPFVADDRRRRDRLAATTADPLYGSAELWAYLDLRDAARALRLALTAPVSGFHPVLVAAPQTLAPYPTDELLARYHPTVPVRRALPGRAVPMDLSRARDLLGFTAEHRVELDLRPLPVDFTRAAG
ncbi:NAD-dependent epimerase/dehydratase family protein [Kribbella sp. NPDC049227]|uniref:NAD-dependent epimerase/dehydratase family protein n=1 Tax=Kribbella sp. NPDC049227 TaxID=3364113 RepID=UPI00371C2C67